MGKGWEKLWRSRHTPIQMQDLFCRATSSWPVCDLPLAQLDGFDLMQDELAHQKVLQFVPDLHHRQHQCCHQLLSPLALMALHQLSRLHQCMNILYWSNAVRLIAAKRFFINCNIFIFRIFPYQNSKALMILKRFALSSIF